MDQESADRDDLRGKNWSEEQLQVAEELGPNSNPLEPVNHPKKRLNKKRVFLWITLLCLIGLVVATIIFITTRNRQEPAPTITINTQSLDNGTLTELTKQAGENAKQQLTVSPDTLFRNNATIQKSLEIAESISVQGTARIQGDITTNGNLNASRSLSVGNNATIGGNLSVNGQLTAGSISVGSITISSVNVSGDLSFGGRIIPGGAAPTVRASVAANGGSVTISGNDTAGTVTIQTGTGTPKSGEMAIITFTKAFSGTPKVQITPVNMAASQLQYYASKSAGFFAVNTSSPSASGTTYTFDYLVTQ